MVPVTPCRVWRGGVDADGYGRRRSRPLSSRLLHRQIMEMVYGPEAIRGKVVMHLCDNPPCFRFDHLHIGTHAENARDMYAKGRDRNSIKTHCVHGHELTDENTYFRTRSGGGRACLVCKRRSNREYMARRYKEK